MGSMVAGGQDEGATAVATLASIVPAATAATPEETAAKAVDQATQAVAQAQDQPTTSAEAQQAVD